MSASISPDQVAAIVAATLSALGVTPETVAAGPVRASTPRAGKNARARAEKKPNRFYAEVIAKRVGCAYGVASCGSFAPNGVGAKQHTTCPKGRKALAAARK